MFFFLHRFWTLQNFYNFEAKCAQNTYKKTILEMYLRTELPFISA